MSKVCLTVTLTLGVKKEIGCCSLGPERIEEKGFWGEGSLSFGCICIGYLPSATLKIFFLAVLRIEFKTCTLSWIPGPFWDKVLLSYELPSLGSDLNIPVSASQNAGITDTTSVYVRLLSMASYVPVRSWSPLSSKNQNSAVAKS